MRYEKYKQTGIPWLPEVPEGWDVRPLKYYIDILPGYAFPSDKFSHQGIPLLRGINVGIGTLKWDDVVYWSDPIDDKLSEYQLSIGDLICGLDRPWISSGTRVAFVKEEDVPSLLLQRVCRIRSKSGIDLMWVYLWLSSFAFQAALGSETTGISVPHISPAQISSFRVFLPPLPEQRAIVAYLDDKCGKIDELVAAKEKEVGLLKELKQTVIADAVTRGISHAESAELAEGVSSPRSLRSLRENNRRLVPSGIPWLPQIPEGWEARKMKYLFRERSDKGHPEESPLCSTQAYGVIPQSLYENRVVVTNKIMWQSLG